MREHEALLPLARLFSSHQTTLSLLELALGKLQAEISIPRLDLNLALVSPGRRRCSSRLRGGLRHDPVWAGYQRELTALTWSECEQGRHTG